MEIKKPDVILIRFGELVLKRNNRVMFERQLLNNIRLVLKKHEHNGVEIFRGGIKIDLNNSSTLEPIIEQLKKIAGISWFAPAWRLDRDPEKLAELAVEAGKQQWQEANSFAVRSQRSDKSFHMTSVDFNYQIGGRIQEATGLQVDLDNPDWEVHVHILWKEAHLFFQKFQGFGGLPVGTAGNVLVLLSGGIDSPVAALHSLKRGCRNDYIHFYAYPNAQTALDEKMKRLIEHLAQFNTSGKIHLVPYLPFQFGSSEVPQRLEMILFRRHVMRVAEKIARRDKLQALVTGESLGQVASQTLENMNSIAKATDMLVLRPLVGMDKEEIIKKARVWDTYQLAIENYKDCCAILARHPRTRSKPDELKKIEDEFKLKELDAQALEQVTTYSFTPEGINKK